MDCEHLCEKSLGVFPKLLVLLRSPLAERDGPFENLVDEVKVLRNLPLSAFKLCGGGGIHCISAVCPNNTLGEDGITRSGGD